MENKKQKMSLKKFLLILIPLMVFLLGAVISITAVMNYFRPVMDNQFGRPPIHVTQKEESKDWDADYYGKKGGSQAAADAAAEKLAVQAMEEGAVLIKNKNSALPLKPENGMTVNAFGWSFYYPVNGGAGAGAIGNENLVSPEEALNSVKISINQELKNSITIGLKITVKFGEAVLPHVLRYR